MKKETKRIIESINEIERKFLSAREDEYESLHTTVLDLVYAYMGKDSELYRKTKRSLNYNWSNKHFDPTRKDEYVDKIRNGIDGLRTFIQINHTPKEPQIRSLYRFLDNSNQVIVWSIFTLIVGGAFQLGMHFGKESILQEQLLQKTLVVPADNNTKQIKPDSTRNEKNIVSDTVKNHPIIKKDTIADVNTHKG